MYPQLADFPIEGRSAGRTGPARDSSLIPPCQMACPLRQDIREYADLIAQGKTMQALQVIRNGNPFPSICAYVCNHPCEDACRRSQVDKPIAVRALKRFAVELGGDIMIRTGAETRYTEKVAVIGSGPAGLSCAYYVRSLGYPATVFEAHSELGGMLRLGIPEYRFPHSIVDTEVERLVQMGVEIRTDTRLVTLDHVFQMGYEAVFVAIGSHGSRKLGIEGEDAPGVEDAVPFLRAVNLGLRPTVGDTVIVIGGGNVAIDAARTARRLGAGQVDLVCLEARDEMPASIAEIEEAVEEGVTLNCSWGPETMTADEGTIGVELKRCASVFDEAGRFNPSFDETVVTRLTADTVIVAIGQMPQVPEGFRLPVGRGSTIRVDPATLTTSHEGVFAGGDAATGVGTVAQALAAGRLAAFRIDDYLRRRYPLPSDGARQNLEGDLQPKTLEAIEKRVRQEPPVVSPEQRVRNFVPTELRFEWPTAIAEARRCLRCGMGAEILFQDQCAACLTCVHACPYHVPHPDPIGTIQLPADQCQACGICVAECPAQAIVLRRQADHRHIAEVLDQGPPNGSGPRQSRPLIVGFCCQYGLYGTGTLAGLWRRSEAGIWIVPVLCVGKVEANHIMRAFETGAEAVFIAGCGEQCARENTAFWALQRTERVKTILTQMGLEPERVRSINLSEQSEDPARELDEFIDAVGALYLASAVEKEVSG